MDNIIEARAGEGLKSLLAEAEDAGKRHLMFKTSDETRPEDLCAVLDHALAYGWEMVDCRKFDPKYRHHPAGGYGEVATYELLLRRRA